MEPLTDITVSAADVETLATIIRSLVTEKLAACGNIVPSIRSIYSWQGAIHDEPEALAIIHTRASLAERVIEYVKQAHPYDEPQVIAIPVMTASAGYHAWVLEETQAAA